MNYVPISLVNGSHGGDSHEVSTEGEGVECVPERLRKASTSTESKVF